MPEAVQPTPMDRGAERARLVALPGDQSGARDEIVRSLRAHRLVTLTGVGGSGKTRLALAVVGELDEIFVDGVWVVELAPISDPKLVSRVVVSVRRQR